MGKRRGDRSRADHWTKRAQSQGFQARSVFKLEEIQRRFRPLSAGQRVLDLGCSPGSWSTYARRQVGPKGAVVGVDLTLVESFPGVFIQADLTEVPAEQLREALGGAADVVLSDMAPKTSGARFTDHVRQLELANAAFERATELLEPGGHFICKVFDGGEAPDFVREVKARFGKLKRVKPDATRSESREFFVVAMGFRPS